MKKGLLISLIILAFTLSANKILSFYLAHKPLANEGECLLITIPNLNTLKIKIVENHNLKAYSDAVAYLPSHFLGDISIPLRASYDELRSFNARKVDCE